LAAKEQKWQEEVRKVQEEKSALSENYTFLQSKVEEVNKTCGDLQDSLNSSESHSNELLKELNRVKEEMIKQEVQVIIYSFPSVSLSVVSFLDGRTIKGQGQGMAREGESCARREEFPTSKPHIIAIEDEGNGENL